MGESLVGQTIRISGGSQPGSDLDAIEVRPHVVENEGVGA